MRSSSPSDQTPTPLGREPPTASLAGWAALLVVGQDGVLTEHASRSIPDCVPVGGSGARGPRRGRVAFDVGARVGVSVRA